MLDTISSILPLHISLASSFSIDSQGYAEIAYYTLA